MSKMIAIVEDEDQIRTQIIKDLSVLGLSNVKSFSNGNDFIEDLKTNSSNYDLVLLDIVMPKIDGLTVLKDYREQYFPTTPIIMLTSKADLETVTKAIALGAKNYLLKPWSVEELGRKIMQLI